MILLITHKNCYDGSAAAFLFRDMYERKRGLKFRVDFDIVYSGWRGEWMERFKNFENKDQLVIHFVDMAPTESELKYLLSLGKKIASILIMDHHDSTIDSYGKFIHNYKFPVVAKIDNSMCGSLAYWKFLNDRMGEDNSKVPELLLAIDRGDRWQIKDSFDLDVNNFLCTKLNPFSKHEEWEYWIKNFRTQDAGNNGKILTEMINSKIQAACKTACIFTINGVDVLGVNNGTFSQEIITELSKMSPTGLGMGYTINSVNKDAYVSLRGKGAKELAESMGGGGHSVAAAFLANLDTILKIINTGRKFQ